MTLQEAQEKLTQLQKKIERKRLLVQAAPHIKMTWVSAYYNEDNVYIEFPVPTSAVEPLLRDAIREMEQEIASLIKEIKLSQLEIKVAE